MTHPLTTGWVEPASAIIGTLIQSSLIVSHMLKYKNGVCFKFNGKYQVCTKCTNKFQ